MNTETEWQPAFALFLAESRAITARAARLTHSIHARAWRLAASVGIGRDACCLHNASIDDRMTGWCKANPERLRAAKRATAILSDWTAHGIAETISARLWKRHLGRFGVPVSDRVRPYRVNRDLLFSRNA